MKSKNDQASWLQGNGARCSAPGKFPPAPYHIVLLGPPGVGKGTQAERLCRHLNACHLSTGDVFRAAKCLSDNQLTPAIKAALGYMRRGDLVPDDTVIDMVVERVRCLNCQHGFVLDGFPRTLAQAEALEALLETINKPLDAVVNFDLPAEMVVERIAGRRICKACGASYHIKNQKPKAEGLCDSCGAALTQREDDREESVRVRLEAYESATRPLIDFYRSRNLLLNINAEGPPADVFDRLCFELSLAMTRKRRTVA
ncbi:MAG: adenylate kinase [Candidatus Sumerlaeaceae bacterium]|nr:adenylate kinase [Candidatus Sumerlaeaceae bacterium]